MPNDDQPVAAAPEAKAPIISDSAWAHASSQWINSWVRNSPISQSVEAWNHLGAILPKLRTYLEAELSK